VPSTAAIWKARSRLGVEPMKLLFATVCRPVAAADTRGAFYRRWRVIAVDGNEIRRLFARFVLPTRHRAEHVWHWSGWRRQRQQ
jgi:hypothetical protein